MCEYYLMNKDSKILRFKLDTSALVPEYVAVEVYNRLPLGFTKIHDWLNRRNYAKHKEHLRRWLSDWGIDTLAGFINITHCLGLNDTLWVKPTDSSLSWSKVSLYTNDFSDVSEHTAFEIGLHGLQLSSASPEMTVDGTFPKCWKREKTETYLYKTGNKGASNVGKEPYAEYQASKILQDICKTYDIDLCIVDYDLTVFKGSLVTKCKMFTSERYGFVPISKLAGDKVETLNSLIAYCDSFGFGKQCRLMLLFDSIVLNQDRHLGNVGFLIDNESYEIIDFAPLFDYNLSMLCRATDDDLENYNKYIKDFDVGHRLGGYFDEVGHKLAKEYLHNLPDMLTIPKHCKYNLEDFRYSLLSKKVNENYDKIIHNTTSFDALT